MESAPTGSTSPLAATTRTKRFHRLSGRSVTFKVVSGLAGMAMVGGAAYGVTSWIVGLNAGSSGRDSRRP